MRYSHSFHSLEAEKGPMSFTFGHKHPGIVGTKSPPPPSPPPPVRYSTLHSATSSWVLHLLSDTGYQRAGEIIRRCSWDCSYTLTYPSTPGQIFRWNRPRAVRLGPTWLPGSGDTVLSFLYHAPHHDKNSHPVL